MIDQISPKVTAELQGIALKTTGLRQQLAAALDGLGGIELDFVYGCYAEGKAGAESDIDPFVVGTVGLRQLSPRLCGVSERYTNEKCTYKNMIDINLRLCSGHFPDEDVFEVMYRCWEGACTTAR